MRLCPRGKTAAGLEKILLTELVNKSLAWSCWLGENIAHRTGKQVFGLEKILLIEMVNNSSIWIGTLTA